MNPTDAAIIICSGIILFSVVVAIPGLIEAEKKLAENPELRHEFQDIYDKNYLEMGPGVGLKSVALIIVLAGAIIAIIWGGVWSTNKSLETKEKKHEEEER